jgi:hypothetical protein|tara:strand:- start:19 stop:225 length:207 start_codon:yes stop_codon:yes gene_type:complete
MPLLYGAHFFLSVLILARGPDLTASPPGHDIPSVFGFKNDKGRPDAATTSNVLAFSRFCDAEKCKNFL